MIKKNSIVNIFVFCSLLLLSSCVDNIDPELVKDLDEETMKDVDIDKALKKLTKDMNFGEALVSGYYYYHKKDLEMMTKCYERALIVGGKQALMKRITMELAEGYIQLKEYEKAKKHANTYVTLYPGDIQAKKAAFLEIQANYLATYTADRDQKKTTETIDLIYAFKEKYDLQNHEKPGALPIDPLDEQYNTQIDDILTQSYNKVIESEINIAETYVKRYNHFKNFSALNGAQKRLKHIRDTILPKIGIENKRLNDLENHVDKNMRFELSKMVIQDILTEVIASEAKDNITDTPDKNLLSDVLIQQDSNLNGLAKENLTTA